MNIHKPNTQETTSRISYHTTVLWTDIFEYSIAYIVCGLETDVSPWELVYCYKRYKPSILMFIGLQSHKKFTTNKHGITQSTQYIPPSCSTVHNATP